MSLRQISLNDRFMRFSPQGTVCSNHPLPCMTFPMKPDLFYYEPFALAKDCLKGHAMSDCSFVNLSLREDQVTWKDVEIVCLTADDCAIT